ncbi:hypothetical protein BLS_008253 [Venturia inaequalis]|uniref:DH domain-containing protein n=1 Tax=Venturia inaequalis TaxID=5025 RepID=A0A8H3U6L3_VENIN|nr:hypothetical protein BLS_008253 [Venturia inaequalis]
MSIGNHSLLATTILLMPDLSYTIPSPVPGRASGAFLDGSSTIGSAEFDFDDDVVNSTVYRRVMATATKGQKNTKPRTKSVVEEDLINLSELGSDDETEMTKSNAQDLEDLLPRDSNTLKSPARAGTMETLQEEHEPGGDSPRSRGMAADRRSQYSHISTMGYRITGPVDMHLYPPGDTSRAGAVNPSWTKASHTGATIDSHSTNNVEVSPAEVTKSFAGSGASSQATALSDATSGAVNFSRKQMPQTTNMSSDNLNEFYDDTTSSVMHFERSAKLPLRGPSPAARLIEEQQLSQQFPPTSIPLKAARHVGLQELWWRLLQLEENYQTSLELLHSLISAEETSLPACGITPSAIRKLQAWHDNHLRQPLRQFMGIGPWTFDYSSIAKAYQAAHAQLVPLYERFAWDLPSVTFQIAAASKPAPRASKDLLTSLGPGMPTRYTCFRSPLTHICSTFDTIQALSDGHGKSNCSQVVGPVREQLRSLIASCNRNILLRWDDLRRSNLSGSYASRDIGQITTELIFPPSQRRNIALLNLGSPTRAVISRADLHWKSSIKHSWSKCHAILLNNYLILASVSDAKGQRQHQVYHLIALPQITTTTMSADAAQAEKNPSKKIKPGKPVYHLFVRTSEFEHILGFTTMVHCLEWHEHLDVALRGEMMTNKKPPPPRLPRSTTPIFPSSFTYQLKINIDIDIDIHEFSNVAMNPKRQSRFPE